ncbi:hypothetical protein NBRC116187_05160 [Halopseudomonas sabulinigri]|uniref:WYL domain-containing protein n=2 Tax=Halopseudomonas sabulinigri TaxID=472181 RepID=A0ABP9ZL12_9GAMM
MKYYKFWVKESVKINVGQSAEFVSILSGSNTSIEDARLELAKQSRFVEQKINGESPADDYEVPIKEHVEQVIDEANIITVCRYGAKILNTCQYTVLDLDDYPIDFFDMFRAVRKLPKKERIVAKFLQRLTKHPELGTDFRIYETTKGVRVIGKKYIEPAGKGYATLMRSLRVDWLYIILSQKQQCYRARVTPKPYRMKIKTIKVTSPLDCETQTYQDWAKDYAVAAQRFSVVKLIQTVGADFSREPVIRLHDTLCNEGRSRTLA